MVKKGYKETKIGMIPLDWEFKELDSIGSFSKGKGISKSDLIDDGLPAVRYAELYTRHDFNIKSFYSFIPKEVAVNSKKIPKNSILFAGSGETAEEIGKSAAFLIDVEAYVSGDTIIFEPDKDDTLFLSYLFNSNIIRRQLFSIAQGNSVVHVYSSNLKKIQTPLPPLPEQKKIAEILSTWDDAIVKQEDLIEKKKELKKGLMQQLLTGKTRFKEFIKSRNFRSVKGIGMVPEDWEVIKIGKHVKYFGGNSFKSSDSITSGIKWLKISNVGKGSINWNAVDFLPEEYRNIYREYLLRTGDMVMALTRPILNNELKISYIKDTDESLLNQRVAKVIFGKMNDRFIYYLHQTPRFIHEMKSEMAGTDPPNIGSRNLESIIVSIPPVLEQNKIAEVLAAADEKIESLKGELKKLKEQKKGLMQKLLTGVVRVK